MERMDNKATDNGGATSTEPKAKTEEEIRAEIQKEYEKIADKRVTDAIKKKEKEWAEKIRVEQMEAQRQERAYLEKHEQELKDKDRDMNIKTLRLDVADALESLHLPAGLRACIEVEDLLSIEDPEDRKSRLTERVRVLERLYNDAVGKAVAEIKKNYLRGDTPIVSNARPITSYDIAKRRGDVMGMLIAEFEDDY